MAGAGVAFVDDLSMQAAGVAGDIVGGAVVFLLAGAVLTETIFAWPGTGRLFVTSISQSDFPVLMGILMQTGLAVVFFQLVTDIAYSFLDPRIRIA